MNQRYARQAMIPHWQQSRLSSARVTILGSDLLAGSIAWGLAALGVGTIYLLDDKRIQNAPMPFIQGKTTKGELTVAALARTLRLINPEVTAIGFGHRLMYDAHSAAIPACDLLIEATQNLNSGLIAATYAQQKHCPLILAMGESGGGLYQVVRPDEVLETEAFRIYRGQTQNMFSALVIGGLVLQEVRQFIQPLPVDTQPVTPVCYARNQPTYSFPARQTQPAQRLLPPHHALLVGAGSMGNFVGLGLAAMGVSHLTIVDPDYVEESNLNRQPFFYGAIGQAKATILADRLRDCVPGLKTTAIVAPVGEAHLQGVDRVFACVDNFATRAWLNQQAQRRQLPLINGGSSPLAGEVQVYWPGRTACLNCTLDIEQLAAAEVGERARCGQTPEASVVISNQVVAGLMVGEAYQPNLLNASALVFDATQPERLGTRPARPACTCHLERRP